MKIIIKKNLKLVASSGKGSQEPKTNKWDSK